MSINFLYSILFSICAFTILLIILIRYFLLKKNNNRNKYFSYLLILNTLQLITDFIYCGLIDYYQEKNLLISIVCKINICLLILSLIVYLYYLFIISVSKEIFEKQKKYVVISLTFLYILTISIITISNINILINEIYSYTGSAVIIGYIAASIVLICLIILISKGMKTTNIQRKCYLLILASTMLYFAFTFITKIDFNGQTFLVSMLTISLYFNVESQDSQSIEKIDKEINTYITQENETYNIISNVNSNINNSINRIEFTSNLMNKNIDKYNQNKDLLTMKEDINNIIDTTQRINKYSMINLNKLESQKTIYTKDILSTYFYNTGLEYNINIKDNIDDKFPNNLEGDIELIQNLITETIQGLNKNISINVDYELTYNELKLFVIFNSNTKISINNILNKKIINGLIKILNVNILIENKQIKYEIKQKVII